MYILSSRFSQPTLELYTVSSSESSGMAKKLIIVLWILSLDIQLSWRPRKTNALSSSKNSSRIQGSGNSVKRKRITWGADGLTTAPGMIRMSVEPWGWRGLRRRGCPGSGTWRDRRMRRAGRGRLWGARIGERRPPGGGPCSRWLQLSGSCSSSHLQPPCLDPSVSRYAVGFF